MNSRPSRRQFSQSFLATAATAVLGGGRIANAGSSQPKTPSKPMPALSSISVVPDAFENHYADLGGIVDLTTGVIWGYEPWASIQNISVSYREGRVNDTYLDLLASLAISAPTDAERTIFADTYAIASRRTWRWPTVFEARAAVEKGLFTFGVGGCNLYYGSPTATLPGVSYGTGNGRWSSSALNNGLVHVWSAADGGTQLVSKTSSFFGIVVSVL